MYKLHIAPFDMHRHVPWNLRNPRRDMQKKSYVVRAR